MNKKYRYLIITLIIFSIFSLKNVYASVDAKINPEWIKYNELSEEEKSLYLAIPNKYIYDYVNTNKNNLRNIKTVFNDNIPTEFSLASLDNKNYVNTIKKDQKSLGLCWAFSALGSMESNMLLRGVQSLDDSISKCNNTNSRDCRVKDDSIINNNYKNLLVSNNATFSERNIDYILSGPTDVTSYTDSNNKYTIVKEKYNPYSYPSRVIGSGGTFSSIGDLFYYGISPKREIDTWEKYNTSMTTKTLEEIFDSVPTDYTVTDYYEYPSMPSRSSSDYIAWQSDLKKLIMTYGSTYVATLGPSSTYAGSCYYYNSSDKMGIIDHSLSCGTTSLGYHAMQIIGWNDNYEYGYCKLGSKASSSYTKSTCESNGYTWTSGKGVWLLKNSWGNVLPYLYLTYDSLASGISGVRGVKVRDYDNTYNEKISNISLNSRTNDSIIYKYGKSSDKEYLSQINVRFYTYLKDYKISISNDGENYTEVDSGTIDLPGMRAFYLNDYVLDNDNFYIKIEGITSIYEAPTVLTKNKCSYLNNCDSSIKLNTYLDNIYYNNTGGTIEVRTKTTNVSSGSILNYKIYNPSGEDITDDIFNVNTYVVTSNNIANIVVGEDYLPGKYTIETSYNDVINDTYFYVLGSNFITFNTDDYIFVSDKNYKINYELLSTKDISNIRFTSSNSSVCTIDNNGVLDIRSSGNSTITLTISTPLGDISNSLQITIYDDDNVDITDIDLGLPSNNLNTNSSYDINLKISPFGNKKNISIENLSSDLITINNDKIITNSKSGTASVKYSLNGFEKVFKFVIVDPIKYSYDNSYTNKDLQINFDINYYRNNFNGYLLFEYNDIISRIDNNISNFNISISNNSIINYNLKYCEKECTTIYSDTITINNIDKDKPYITYDYSNNKKELIINIKDDISGIKEDNYYYGISSNNIDIPDFKTFKNNEAIKDNLINHTNRFLWIKNFKDNAGNYLCSSNYCIYEIDTIFNTYRVNYYDDDGKTLLMSKEYNEGDVIEDYTYSKEDDIYEYEFISFDGYTPGMTINSDMNFYIKYKKIAKYIESNNYLIKDNYIRNIHLNNIFNRYNYNDFINNLFHYDDFKLYNSNENYSDSAYIKTGDIFKNKYNSYKIVITGDVTGDGYVKMNDLMKIANYLIDGKSLKEEYLYAADITMDNKVKMNDLMKMANAMLNGGSL